MKKFKLKPSFINSLFIKGFLVVILFQLVSCKKTEPAPNYTNFKITNVKINQVPSFDPNGNDWDFGGYPDIYFNMEDVNSNIYFDGTASTITNVSQFPISWNFVSAYQITNTSVTQYVTVYDNDDVTADEEMGYVGFKMDDYKSGYQTTITKSNGSLSVTITGTWY
jgi:hypothetical protein